MKTIFATNINEWSDRDLEGLGALRVKNGNVYKWVKVSTIPASKNRVCYYTAEDTVIIGTTDGLAPAGILQADIPEGISNAYAWILVYGFCEVVKGGSISNGNLIKSNANGQVVVDSSLSADTIGVMIDTTNSIALIKLL